LQIKVEKGKDIMTKNEIIISLQNGINPYEEYYVEDEIMEAMLEYPNPFELVAPILEIIESNPDIDFGTPGDLVHFVEKFYKKGYEELLLKSVRKNPTMHNIWMLHRCYIDEDNPLHSKFSLLIKEIKEDKSVSSKIKEVIDDITGYIKQKYPQEKSKCSGDNCTATDGLNIFDVDGIPVPMCSSCAKRLETKINNAYEDFRLQPNNYLQGSIAAIVFSIPGILVTFILFLLGRIAGASGLIYFYLSQKGYVWAKGKMNKMGVLIISLISLVYTAVGVYLSYIAVIIKEVLKLPEIKGYPIFEIVKLSFESVREPEVKRELLTNIYLSLFLCGICILLNMIQLLKSTGKVKIKKA